MTENEAIIELHKIRPRGSIIPQKRAEALDVAIQAIEKQSMVNEILHELREYSAIGTIEELQALKEKNTPKELAEEYDNDVCEWKQHEREIDVYFTECGQAHIFVDGNPEENNHVFCPYCGKKIKVVVE